MDNNLYTQIGIVLIIALASKNAILIVEFARDIRSTGKRIREAAVEAARLRFRPILMTSFAFILGVVPLVIANGAGAAGQRALGHGGVRRHDRLDGPGRVLRAGVLRGLPERSANGSAAKESKSGRRSNNRRANSCRNSCAQTIKALRRHEPQTSLTCMRPTTSRLK